MPATRITSLLLVMACLLVSIVSTTRTHAQEKQEVEQALRKILPQDGGTGIEDADSTRVNLAVIAGFILVFGATWILVRFVAWGVMATSFVGGLMLVYMLLVDKHISTWEQLLVAELWIGIAAGITARTAYLYELKSNESLSALVNEQKKAIAKLTVDVQALEKKLAETRALGH